MLSIHRKDATVCLSGELDLSSYEQLHRELDRIVGPVRLDLAGLTFMDSTGLRLILERLPCGPVTIAFPRAQVLRLLEISKLLDVEGLTVEQTATANRAQAGLGTQGADGRSDRKTL